MNKDDRDKIMTYIIFDGRFDEVSIEATRDLMRIINDVIRDRYQDKT